MIELLQEGDDGKVICGPAFPDVGPVAKLPSEVRPIARKPLAAVRGSAREREEMRTVFSQPEEAFLRTFVYIDPRTNTPDPNYTITFYVPHYLMAPNGINPSDRACRLAAERAGWVW